MSGPLIIVATVFAEAAHRDAIEQALREAVSAVIKEPGCERYELHQNLADPNTFVMIEQWHDSAAADVHAKAPAFVALSKALTGRATLYVTQLARLA